MPSTLEDLSRYQLIVLTVSASCGMIMWSRSGPLCALAQAAATAVGHFPWFLTYNFLDGYVPKSQQAMTSLPVVGSLDRLFRPVLPLVGYSINSLRVIKTTKQTAQMN
jgi:hypothetical protein